MTQYKRSVSARTLQQHIEIPFSSENKSYNTWAPHWERIRDCVIGSVAIKSKREKYLPRMYGHDAAQYAAFLSRSVYYNMAGRTLNALVGTMYKRDPILENLPEWMEEDFTADGLSLKLAAKNCAAEVLSVGRFGMLVDIGSEPGHDKKPFVAQYSAESIVDWQVGRINDRQILTHVVLAESSADTGLRYRVLALEPSPTGWSYVVAVFDGRDGLPDLERAEPIEMFEPTIRGRRLDYIPFVIVGPFANSPAIQKPPLLDICELNISHYQTYAMLQHGRFYTASPVYTVSTGTGGEEPAEYMVAPDMVWELGAEGRASILEFSGKGLSTLENALETLEDQIATLGGRMIGGGENKAAESDNSLKLREANEQTLLLNAADTIDEAFNQCIQWMADFAGVVPQAKRAEMRFSLSRDFLTREIGSRELRAIASMYSDGIVPLDVLYDYLRSAQVIPDGYSKDQFAKSLKDPEQFTNQLAVIEAQRTIADPAYVAEAV